MYNSGGDNNHQMNGGGGGAGNSDAGSGRNAPSSVYANGNTNTQSGGYNNENSSNLGTRETGIIEKLLVSFMSYIFIIFNLCHPWAGVDITSYVQTSIMFPVIKSFPMIPLLNRPHQMFIF